jgi:hydroxymethylpyrimidine/phosphomethylpyrimidine kinase
MPSEINGNPFACWPPHPPLCPQQTRMTTRRPRKPSTPTRSNMTPSSPPTVLCIGGHDPCSGAGIVADAESVRAAGAFPLTLVSALTDQDSCGVRGIFAQAPERLEAQWRTVLADGAPRAIKIGLIGDAALVPVLCALIDACEGVPAVLDPVLASGTGQAVADSALVEALRDALLPRVALVTPNVPEARTLTGASDPASCARALLSAGTPWALVTGTHDRTTEVSNRLLGPEGFEQTLTWPRLPGEFHGSGCTLASAIAARLALGFSMPAAVAAAQSFAWNALARALRTGRCQLTPNRLYALEPVHSTQEAIQ